MRVYDEAGDLSVLEDFSEDPARQVVGRVVDVEDHGVLAQDVESAQILFEVVPREVYQEGFLVDGFGGVLDELVSCRGRDDWVSGDIHPEKNEVTEDTMPSDLSACLYL